MVSFIFFYLHYLGKMTHFDDHIFSDRFSNYQRVCLGGHWIRFDGGSYPLRLRLDIWALGNPWFGSTWRRWWEPFCYLAREHACPEIANGWNRVEAYWLGIPTDMNQHHVQNLYLCCLVSALGFQIPSLDCTIYGLGFSKAFTHRFPCWGSRWVSMPLWAPMRSKSLGAKWIWWAA